MSTRPSSEDLFESSRMSFGEHLEELRKVLVKSLIGIALGTIIGLMFSDQVVKILKAPLDRALAKFQQEQDTQRLKGTAGWMSPDLAPWLAEERQTPETVYVDPGQLVTALRSVQPDFLTGVEISAYKFLPRNVRPGKAGEICRKLLGVEQNREAAPAKLQVLWDLLTDTERTMVRRLAKDETSSATEVEDIAAMFNRLLGLRELNQAPAYADLLAPPSSTAKLLLGSTEENPLQLMADALTRNFDDDANRRLNRALLAYVFPNELQPLKAELVPLQTWRQVNTQPQALSVVEPFMIWMKAGIISGIVLASPYVFLQLWSFVAAGLYPHEKSHVYLYLPISLGLFFAGILLAYFFVFDPVLQFLFSFNARLGISPETRINDWLGFFMFLPLGFGIAFQLPLVMLLLNRLGVMSVEMYLSKWRIAIMIIFVVAMVLTPADPISMLLMAFPLTGLYFVGIALCQWMPGRRINPFGDLPEPA
jgi:sec-independent protein translocase protein TatC